MLIIYEVLKMRNNLQFKCLKNKHTYVEEISFDVDNHALRIKVDIGNHQDDGISSTQYIRDQSLWDELKDFYRHLINGYNATYCMMKKNM